jgi:glutamate--cysteine ligase
VLLNNDLSGACSRYPQGILNIPVMPPLALGWWNPPQVAALRPVSPGAATEFAAIADIDPWFIDPVYRMCGKIDFQKREGEDCLTRLCGRSAEPRSAPSTANTGSTKSRS